MQKPTYAALVSRFWSKVYKTDCCWLWRGFIDAEGYGIFYVDRQGYRAHRFAYESLHGPINKALHCGHRCHVRWCVRPEHLYPCTPAQNIADRDKAAKVICACALIIPQYIRPLTAEERFWRCVKKSRRGCWIWTGDINRNGYGKFVYQRRTTGAHKFSYQLHFGLILPGMLVLHRCDNPRCVRPNHLYAGTPQENMRDMVRKGRNFMGRGDQHPNTKLPDAAVLEICALRETMKLREIAALFHISESWVSTISRGLSRTSVTAHQPQQAPKFLRRGEEHHNARLSDVQVAEIRALRATMTVRAIASRFHLSISGVHSILWGRTR